jgi:hypothetical protein
LKFRKLTPLLLLLIQGTAFASGEPYPIGARSWAMGNSLVAVADRFSVINNPAGLGFLQGNFINVAYHTRYNVAGLQNASLSGNYNTKLANFGIALEKFGDKLYNEQKYGLAIGKSTQRVALGIKATYLQATIENLSNQKTFLTEFGVIAKMTSKFQVGFHGYNLLGAKLYASQKVPTVLRLGAGFTPTKQILITAEAERNLDYPTIFKAGIEYQIVNNVFFRTGITSRINNAHFGIGISKKNFTLDYATSTHQSLGLSHHLTLSFSRLSSGEGIKNKNTAK